MQCSSGKESPRDFPSHESRLIVACLTTASGWLHKRSLYLITFQLVPCTLFNTVVQTFLAMKSFAEGSSMDPCHLACVSKSVLRDVIPLIGCSTQLPRSAVGVTRELGLTAQCPFLVVILIFRIPKAFCSWQRVRAEATCRDAWRYSSWDSSSNAISSCFRYHFCS